MKTLIDTATTLRILSMIIKPVKETDAYKLGIVDEHGNNLIKSKNFTSSEQKNSYTILDRLVFNIKKLINKLPGGENKAKNLLASYLLVKESLEHNLETLIEEDLFWICENLDSLSTESDIILSEEVAANSTGSAISGINSNDVAVPTKKKSIILKRFKIPELPS